MESIMSIFTPKKMTSFLNENATVRQAIELFDVHKYSVIPLVDNEGHYAGTLSEGDLLRFLKNKVGYDIKAAEKVSIKDMERYREYRALEVSSMRSEFFVLSLDQNFIPVTDDKGIYIGIVTRREIIKVLSNKMKCNIKNSPKL